MSTFDFDEVVEQFHLALGEFVKGNPEPLKGMYSHQQITVANPFGPPVRGWKQAAEIADRAALLYRDGEVVGFENVAKCVTPELAYIVELERFRVKMGGRQDITPVTLRTTSIFRPEEGTWKVVHRHADPITTVQTPESVIQQ
jgi:ketosteroid isomerase-like protein